MLCFSFVLASFEFVGTLATSLAGVSVGHRTELLMLRVQDTRSYGCRMS